MRNLDGVTQMRFYPFHVGDYQAHTSHLTDVEDLAYRRMLDLYYLGEAPLPNDPQWIARRIRMPAAAQEVQQVLNEYFTISEDGFRRNKRCDLEISSYQRMKTGGAKGAAKRWPKDKGAGGENGEGNGEGIQGGNEGVTPPPLATKNHEPGTNKNKEGVLASKPIDVSNLLWKSYLLVRKTKNLPFTQLAFEALEREAKKANLTIPQVLTLCCEQGWAGFKAEWLEEEKKKKQGASKSNPDFAGFL